MKKHIIGALVVLLLPAVCLAAGEAVVKTGKQSDANITGHVVDAKSGEHLAYATVAVKGTTIGCATDATGHYFLKNLPLGRFTLVASSVGYRSAETTVEIVADRTAEVNFSLNEEALAVEEVVVSASRTETNRKFSPTIVSVASTKLFESTASSNLAETMNFQSGLRVENNCGNCGTTQLRINGLEGQYSQVLLDSRPIFSSLASVYGLEQLPVAMIERVEVIRGGGSALFGANAIGGVVNIITKEPLYNSVTLANTTNISEDGTADFNTSLNGSFVSDDYKTGVYLFGMIRDRDSYDRNGDGFSDIPELNSETVGFRAYYKTSPYTRLTAEYHHIHEFRRGGNAFDLPPHMADIAEQLNHKIDGGGLKFDWFSPDGRHRLGVYASAQRIGRDSYFGTDRNPDAYGATGDETFVAGTQYTCSFERLLFLPSELTAGVEYNYNALDDKYLGFGRDFRQTTRSTGFFFQNEWRSERLNFLVGGRVDKHNMMKNAVFSPRVNVRYSPTPAVGLRASYASGYRAPQAYNEDLHIDALDNKVAVIRLDPNLRPEYSHSLSASVDLYRNFGRVQGNLLVEGFYTVLDDLFTLEKVGEDEQGNVIKERRNAAGATVAGIGVEAKAGIPGRFEFQLGYTFQRSRYDEPERWSDEVAPQRRMFRSPDHYGYLTAVCTLTRGFTASLFGNYTGRMLVQHNAGFIAKDTERLTPDFWDMGARLSYTLSLTRQLRLELNAGVKNLFDSFQHDLDFGQRKDAAYIYGPAAHLFHRCEIRVMTLRGVPPMESQPVAENARLPSYELRREPCVRAVSGISNRSPLRAGASCPACGRFCRRNRCGILPVVVGVCHFENDARRHRVFAVPEAERCTDLAAVDGLLRTAEQLPHQRLGHVDRQPAAGRRVHFGQVFPQAGHAPQGEPLLFGEIVVERQPEFGIGRDRRQ